MNSTSSSMASFYEMNQASGSRIIGEQTRAPVATSSNNIGPIENSPTPIDLSIERVRPVNFRLPPPPSYHGSHLKDFSFLKSPPFFLTNWSVNLKSVNLEVDSTGLIMELKGTLLEEDRRTVSNSNHNAGKIQFILAKNVVNTNNGMYHLLGQITKGYPYDLYRACLEANGIPNTWKSILAQFSTKLPNYNQSITTAALNLANTNNSGLKGLLEQFKVLQRLLLLTEFRNKKCVASRKPISLFRSTFHRKLKNLCATVDDKIITKLRSEMNSN